MQKSNIQDIFEKALELPRNEQEEFIRFACGGDLNLVKEVLSLLAFTDDDDDDSMDGFHTPSTATSDELIGKTIGHYTLRSVIGEGGFGVVYMAEQTQPVKRRVAIKIIKLGMDSKAVIARFQAERQALAIMDHPGVARIFDGGTTDQGRPYFVMELVDGVPITDYCDTHTLDLRERIILFQSVCDAIQHAHTKGVIHRDLKPSNILVEYLDGQPVIKVIDFGIAKALNQELTEQTLFTESGQLIGTPEYMSPEQAEMSALNVDTRSDVYSLGILLYELLSGALPFDSRSLRAAGIAEIQRIIREEDPPKPSTRYSSVMTASAEDCETIARARAADPKALPRSLQGDLDWITMKCLEKERSRRYESPSALAQDLSRYLGDRPVEASPPSLKYRLHKSFRRNKKAVITASIVIPSLLILLALSTFFLFENYRKDQLYDFLNEYQTSVLKDVVQKSVERNKPEIAEVILQSALNQMERNRDIIDDEMYLNTLHNVARSYRSIDRIEEALAITDLAETFINKNRQTTVDKSVARWLLVRMRVDLLSDRSDPEDSIQRYLELLDLLETVDLKMNGYVQKAMLHADIAELHRGKNDHQAAIHHRIQAFEILSEQNVVDDHDSRYWLHHSAEQVAQAYRRADEPMEAGRLAEYQS